MAVAVAYTDDASSSPGVYTLILRCDVAQTITVGRLGVMLTQPGYYVYVGSALGPGGLAGRLHHHLSPVRKPHWHIDYLRRVTAIVAVWYSVGSTRYEHVWASVLAQMAGATVLLHGFGASDCACTAHLFHFAAAPLLAAFQRDLAVCKPGVQCVLWSPFAPPGRVDET